VSDGLAAGFKRALGPDATERTDAETRAERDQIERWASAVGAEIGRFLLPAAEVEPPRGWRAGAGDLTPQAGAGVFGVHSPNAPTDGVARQENRLILRVDAGDLGDLALVVDQNAAGIHVTIGVGDARAEAAIGSERMTLVRALENSGISVQSVSVARLSTFGTVLARSRTSASHPLQSSGSAEGDEQEQRRLARKLNVIG
jgi:hypothetical protein